MLEVQVIGCRYHTPLEINELELSANIKQYVR